VELWSDVFDFAPGCKSKRVKRSSGWTDLKNGQCKNNRNEIVRCYGLMPVDCRKGCDAQDFGFDCKHKSKSCYFVLICPVAVVGESYTVFP
jgi:hypothetical protein